VAFIARLDRATQHSSAPMMDREALEYWMPAFRGDDGLSWSGAVHSG
jgi:hypothetical protein